MQSCVEWYPTIAMVAIDLAFAVSNILLKKVVGNGTNHLVFITYRQCVSAVFLAPLAYFVERKSRPKLTFNILCQLFLSAMIGASLTQFFVLLGIEYTSATFSCAFINVVPVVTFLMALPFGLEKINMKSISGKAKVLGTIVCLAGAILLALWKGEPLVHFTDKQHLISRVVENATKVMDTYKRKKRWTLGSIAMLAGTLTWSSWFLLQSAISKKYPCQYSSTAIMNFFSAIQSAVLTLCIDRNLSVWILKNKLDILAALYAGMIGSGLCFVGMSWCVKKRGPVFTAAFSPSIQIMAAMLDVPFLREQFYLGSLIGSVIVIVGLYILLWGKNREMLHKENKVVEETTEAKDQEPQLQVIKITQ